MLFLLWLLPFLIKKISNLIYKFQNIRFLCHPNQEATGIRFLPGTKAGPGLGLRYRDWTGNRYYVALLHNTLHQLNHKTS